MKRKKLKVKNIKCLCKLLFLGILLSFEIIAFISLKVDVKFFEFEKILKVEDKDVVIDPIEEYSFSLIMGGDALIHSAVYGDAKVGNKYDFNGMLANIKPIISKYDLAYYNQETILGGTELGLSTYPRFNSPYEVGDAFINCGFNVVSLANNHTLDRGSNAIINSRKYWNSKDVMVNGSATSLEERNNIDIKEKNGITYALLSYTTTTNGLTRKNNYYVNWYDKEIVKQDVMAIRDKVDFLMVAMHWGTEYYTGVKSNQREIAEYLASLDVDLVIGTHPHVIEPAEYIDDTFVIYSLGNIISAQRTDEQLSGLLMSVTVNKVIDTEKQTITVSVDNPTAQFIYTYSKRTSSGGRYDFKLYPYSMLNEQLFPNYKTMYNKLKTRMTSLDSNIKVIGLEGDIDGNIK